MTSLRSPVELVKHYVNICNTALTTQSDSALYRPIIELLRHVFSDRTINIEVLDNEGTVIARASTRFVDGEFQPVAERSDDEDAHLSLSVGYLNRIVDDADHYIRHPERLDWSWLREAAGH